MMDHYTVMGRLGYYAPRMLSLPFGDPYDYEITVAVYSPPQTGSRRKRKRRTFHPGWRTHVDFAHQKAQIRYEYLPDWFFECITMEL